MDTVCVIVCAKDFVLWVDAPVCVYVGVYFEWAGKSVFEVWEDPYQAIHCERAESVLLSSRYVRARIVVRSYSISGNEVGNICGEHGRFVICGVGIWVGCIPSPKLCECGDW